MKEIDEMYVHKFRTPELMVVDEQELEEDRAYLRAMYPMRAKLILVMVEDACDRLWNMKEVLCLQFIQTR